MAGAGHRAGPETQRDLRHQTGEGFLSEMAVAQLSIQSERELPQGLWTHLRYDYWKGGRLRGAEIQRNLAFGLPSWELVSPLKTN